MELRRIIIAAALALFPALGNAQQTQSTINPNVPPVGFFVEQSGPQFRDNFQRAINDINVLFGGTRGVPQSFIGSNIAAITTDGAQITVQNSSTTQGNLFTGTTGGVVYDGVRSTVFIPPASTALSGNAFGAYVRNRSAGGAAGNGVLYYGLITCGVSNSSCWGENPRIVDSENSTGSGLTGVRLIGNELDFAAFNAGTTIQGVAADITASAVQPTFASGYGCTGKAAAKFTFCFTTNDGGVSTAIAVGALSVSGTSIASQPIQFSYFDSGSTEQFPTLSSDGSGRLAWTGKGATFAAGTLASTLNALNVTGTLPNVAAAQVGMNLTVGTTAGTNPTIMAALNATLGAGYTGSGDTIAMLMTDNAAGTASTAIGAGAPHGNSATQATALATTTGANFGHTGTAGSGNVNVGTAGYTYTGKSAATNVAVLGDSLNAGGGGAVQIAGLFSLHGAMPAVSAALIADNAATSSPVALFMVAGVTKAQIDASGLIITPGYTIAGLPACGAGQTGARAHVTNGVASPTFLAAVSATGAATDPVFCNGAAWVYG